MYDTFMYLRMCEIRIFYSSWNFDHVTTREPSITEGTLRNLKIHNGESADNVWLTLGIGIFYWPMNLFISSYTYILYKRLWQKYISAGAAQSYLNCFDSVQNRLRWRIGEYMISIPHFYFPQIHHLKLAASLSLCPSQMSTWFANFHKNHFKSLKRSRITRILFIFYFFQIQ